MAIEYNFKYMPLVGKLSGKSMAEQTETAINEIAKIVNDNTAQAEIINTLAEEANANSVEALEKANEALETSGRVYIKETGAVDLDSYCESQLIYINNIFSQNLPVESKGFLEVKTNDDKTQATQVFIDDLNKEIYTRSGVITETQVGDITTYTASYGAWNKSASTNYVENMVLIRQNSTAYSVGDIARSTSLASYMVLECTSAGTTGASEPSFSGADVGDVITDGSVSWTIIKYASTKYVQEEVSNFLPLSGGTITGNVFAPTPTAGDDSTKLATTEFVQNEISAINTRLGTILSASGNDTTVNAYGTLCSITTHPAGVFLITSFMDLSYSGTSIYVSAIVVNGSNQVSTRNTSVSGGGSCAVWIGSVGENVAVELRGYQTQEGTMRGFLRMVQLA